MTDSTTMRQVIFADRPTGDIIPGTTFNTKIVPRPTADELQDGQILVEVNYLSLDSSMRTWLKDVYTYLPPVKLGEVMRGVTASRVLASKSKQAKPGDYVLAMTGWTEYAILPEGAFEPASCFPDVQDPKNVVSLFGLTGVAAWVGMNKIGEPKPGQTVVVSGAAGATGSVAGQIAKAKGARVVGVAGGEEKCKWLVEELGFDAAVDYKAPDFHKQFKEATPDLIDVFFDNVGGEILNMCLARAKNHARFVMCGGVSQYNSATAQGPSNINVVVSKRIRMEGYIVFDHKEDYARARKELAQWVAEGKMKSAEHIVKGGLDNAAEGLVGLYKGVNKGKMLVEIKNPNENAAKL